LNWVALLSVSKRTMTVLLAPGAGGNVHITTEPPSSVFEGVPTSTPSWDLMSEEGARSHDADLPPPLPPGFELAEVEESGPQPATANVTPARAVMIRNFLMTEQSKDRPQVGAGSDTPVSPNRRANLESRDHLSAPAMMSPPATSAAKLATVKNPTKIVAGSEVINPSLYASDPVSFPSA